MKRPLPLLITLALASSTLTSHALWGKAETKTESGNADLKLGEYKGLKHAIGCKEFENESGWRGEWDLGRNLTTMLESALYDSGRFVIVEREKLKDVLAEQDLITSGRAAKAKQVAQTGLIRPARYIATGAITEVSYNQSGGGAGISIKGFRVGGSRSDAQIALVVKLVDTTTGEIIAKERIVGKAGATGLSVGLSSGSVGVDVGGFKKTPIGQAAQDCVNQAAALIAKKMETIPFEGRVIRASGGKVYINRGAEFGVEPGQILTMATEGDLLTDPDTGAILGRTEGETIGKLKVVKVEEKLSICDVLEGDKNPSPGVRVIPGT